MSRTAPHVDASTPSEDLLARCHDATPTSEREAILAEVVMRHLALADTLASRMRGSGEEAADLIQVARLGLVLAAHRFEPARGVPFTAFARVTIEGELLRHMRDHAWMVRPPRRLLELRPAVIQARDELRQELDEEPTVNEVAARAGCEVRDAVEALTLSSARRPDSLDAPDLDGVTLAERLHEPEQRLDEHLDAIVLGTEVGRLQEREQEVLRLRYVEDSSQRQIAERIGVSQMHVSRILAQAVSLLRGRVVQYE